MEKNKGLIVSVISSYWQAFRIIFVIFSLYLMGIAFHSWDGFRYYGSLTDFLEGIAFVLILWSILAWISAIFVLVLFKIVQCGCLRVGLKVKIEYILMFIFTLIFLGILVWKGSSLIKRLPHYSIAKNKIKLISLHYGMDINQIKFIILIAAAIILITLAVILTTLIRNKAVLWISLIQERITPLVYLFGIFVMLSVPLLTYHIAKNHMIREKDKVVLSRISQTPLTNRKCPNILLVTFDALTARNMSLYGYHRETTPFIAEWAKNASVFTMAEAGSNYTSPTVASLMTGKRVWTHQLYQPHGYNVINADIENLPLLLKKNGYYNIALIQNYLASVKTLGISDSVDIAPIVAEFMEPTSIVNVATKKLFQLFGSRYHLYNWLFQTAFLGHVFYRKIPIEVTVTEYPPEIVFNRFIEIIDKNPPEPFFAWLHVFPPHDPYLPPEPFMGMFDSSSKLRTEKSQWLSNDFETARARYDEFIRYCDKTFENFIMQLSKRNILGNTVIILSADHGHSFEHGYRGHGGPHLYEQLTNIPLIIKEPNQTKRRIIDDVVEQIDIAPTILELANISLPSWMEGRSLAPLVRGKKLTLKPALSMMLESTPRGQKIKEGTFAVWENNYKLIHYLKENKSLLFNLKEDPSELKNLFDEKKEIGQRLLALILDNLKKANERIGKGE